MFLQPIIKQPLTPFAIKLVCLLTVGSLIITFALLQNPFHNLNTTAYAVTEDENPPALFTEYQIDLRSFYEEQSGFGPLPIGTYSSPDSFGAYFLLPVADTLYLGLGQYPARADGALVATLNANASTLEKIPIQNSDGNKITEQGIHILLYDSINNLVIFPGTDPTDSWALGNFYSIDPTQRVGTKHRDHAGLVEVVHGWGLAINPVGKYFYGTGSYLYNAPFSNTPVAVGEVFKSDNQGVFWHRITIDPAESASISSFLSPFRIYSLAWLNNILYAATSESTVWYTKDEGTHWQMVDGVDIDPVLTPIKLHSGGENQEFVLATSPNGRSLQKINSDRSTQQFDLPFTAMVGGYRHGKITTDGEWVYILSEDTSLRQNSLYRSKDFANWQLVDNLPAYNPVAGGKATTLTFWPLKQEIVVGVDGSQAKLYAIPVSNIPIINVTPTVAPSPTILPSPTTAPQPTPTPQACQADPDINNSGAVDLADISILISALLIEGKDLPADLNCDGVVNLSDFSILVSNLGLSKLLRWFFQCFGTCFEARKWAVST